MYRPLGHKPLNCMVRSMVDKFIFVCLAILDNESLNQDNKGDWLGERRRREENLYNCSL